MICNKEHRYLPQLEDLPEAQAGAGRHVCAGCAYEQGYDDALGGNASNMRVAQLDESQAGTGRHKDVQAAYNLGYQNGAAKAAGN